MDKILFTILTCNRFHYLKNCLESIIECVDLDRIKILVCDNNTVEKGFDSYLNDKANDIDIKIKKFDNRSRNELYRAMNWGVKYAKKEGFKIINFIQDDYQYVFKNDKHIDEVLDIFKKQKHIGQINYNFVWKRKRKGIGKINHFSSCNTNYAVFMQKRLVDSGFTRVDLYDKTGPYPVDAVSWGGNIKKGFGKRPGRYVGVENGEIWFGRECERRKIRRAISLFPNVTMIYDCAYVRGDIRIGRYFKPTNKYYIELFDERKKEKLMKCHNEKKFSYIEDFCQAWDWEAMTTEKHSPVKNSSSIYS
tara:strand:+ start:871 stop:1788 length:918 start_codon:yes stop_codon:yes gene_type:complete